MEEKTRYKIIDFVDRCFRDIADKDYITARICYRLDLTDQFLWSGLQSIEKYLKAIILYNDGNTQQINHDLSKGLNTVKKIGEIDWDFDDSIRQFLEYMTSTGGDRYFSQPRGTAGDELLKLDNAVWTIRRYCQDFTSLKKNKGLRNNLDFGEYINFLQSEDCQKRANTFRLSPPGYLERVLDDGEFKRQREYLIWKNFYYGANKKHRFNFTRKISGSTPGHYFFPEIYPWVKQRVKLSKEVVQYFEKHKDDLSKAKQTSGQVTF